MNAFFNVSVKKNLKKITHTVFLTLALSGYSLTSYANDFFSLETIGCPIYPSKDIKIDKNYVTLTEKNQIWQIARDGNVTLNGKLVKLTEKAKSSAQKYQTSLRNELPEFYETTQNLIETNLTKLDTVIEKTLGEKSRLRETISELKPVIQEEISLILSKEQEGILGLSLTNLKGINERIQKLMNEHSQSIFQDTLSEIATHQLFGKKENKISLSTLQEELRSTFDGENMKAKALLEKACQSFSDWKALESDFINEKTLQENSDII